MSQPWGFNHRHEKSLRGWLAMKWYRHRSRVIRRARDRRR